jgi:arabinogalactan endo-1,4-beta-galactosidase
MSKFSEMFPNRFLKAPDLKGKQMQVVMSHISTEKIGDADRPVLYFQNKDKGLVLNKTNGNTIAYAFGDDTEDWRGGEIVLFETMVDFQGKTMPAIRCRVTPRKQNAPTAPEIEDDITF